MSMFRRLFAKLFGSNDENEIVNTDPGAERESRKRCNSFLLENDMEIIEPDSKRSRTTSVTTSLQNISNFNMSNNDSSRRSTGAVKKIKKPNEPTSSTRIWMTPMQLERSRNVEVTSRQRSIEQQTENSTHPPSSNSDNRPVSQRRKFNSIFPDYLTKKRLSNQKISNAFNSSINIEQHNMYRNLLKQFTPSSSRLSNGSSYHSLTSGSYRSGLEVVDLTAENKSGLSSSRHNSTCNNEKPIELTDSDDDVVEVEPPRKVNSLRRSLELQPIFNAKWIEDLTKRFSETDLEKRHSIKQVHSLSKILSEANEELVKTTDERLKKHLKQREAIIIDDESEEDDVHEILPELTQQQLDRINNALYTRSGGSLISKFGLSIGRNDIQTLDKLNWLNDEVINFYMNLLNQRSEQNERLPKVYTKNTFFYPKLISSGHAGVKRWTRKVDIFSYDIIPVPIHLRVHWCMAIIDLRSKTIRYYDSMGSPNNTCLDALERYLQEESLQKKSTVLDTSTWKKENVKNIPQQMNGSDCGVFSCMFAEYLCRNAKITFSQGEMPYFRKKMILEILEGKLIT